MVADPFRSSGPSRSSGPPRSSGSSRSSNTPGEFYTRYARLYDRIASDAPFAEGLRRHAVTELDPHRGDVVVEMGCGTGANFPALRDAVGPEGSVVGVDLSLGVLRRARDRISRREWENVHVVRGDARRPGFAPDGFGTDRFGGPAGEVDAVFVSFVSGMVGDPGTAVDRWCDLVGDGGRVGLLDLARSTHPAGRFLNPAFGAFVRMGSPPGTRFQHTPPVRVLDERVREAHRRLHERAVTARTSRRLAGFARSTAGTVERNAAGSDGRDQIHTHR